MDLKTKHFADEPIRENLLISAKHVGCWQEGFGADHLRPELYKPNRGDKGPFPTSGFPYIIHALVVDKRNIPIFIKYDDPHKKCQELVEVIAQQMGTRADLITVYQKNGDPVVPEAPLEKLKLKFQDIVLVDFDRSSFKPGNASKTIHGRFFHQTGDSDKSLFGSAP